ncbi:MAG: biopolymer transporter ExbD [Rubricoccaceae bacterium]
MPLLKKRQKRNPEIPTASMADIAFLLLIFFLVTTTINADKGIYMQLPPKLEETEPPEIRQRNLLNILVNSDGTVLLDNEVTNTGQIRATVKRHVTNNGQDPDLSESPDKAVVSFKTKRGLPYETYIEVLDEIKSAYNEIYDSEARAVAGVDYGVYRARLGEDDPDLVKDKFPVKISLAEPDPGE